jgi:glycosyltransferase involved in cell wall biosynthesis
MEQDFDSFEVIVSDDCSQENPRERVEDYFLRNGFKHYRIVVHDTNLGTVKNCLEAIRNAQGEYIKWIGAGDLLYSSDTLTKIYEFSHKNAIDYAFGRIKTFSRHNDEVVVRSFDAPTKPEQYLGHQDKQLILTQLLLRSDWIPGGSLFFRREYLIGSLDTLANDCGVCYCEDLVSVLVAFFGRIDFFDEHLLWYEWGVGISSSGSKAQRKRMYTDHTNFFTHLKKLNPSSSLVKKAFRRFMIKRFVMLYTPFAEVFRRIKASQYRISESAQSLSEQDFLRRNLWHD